MAEITDFHQLPDGLLGLSCVGRQRFRIIERSRQADGLHLGEVQWLDAEPAMPVPPRHARLAELLRTVLPQLGEVYTGHSRCGSTMPRGWAIAWPKSCRFRSPTSRAISKSTIPSSGLDRLAPMAPKAAGGVGHPRPRVSHSARPIAAAQGSSQ